MVYGYYNYETRIAFFPQFPIEWIVLAERLVKITVDYCVKLPLGKIGKKAVELIAQSSF